MPLRGARGDRIGARACPAAAALVMPLHMADVLLGVLRRLRELRSEPDDDHARRGDCGIAPGLACAGISRSVTIERACRSGGGADISKMRPNHTRCVVCCTYGASPHPGTAQRSRRLRLQWRFQPAGASSDARASLFSMKGS